MNTLSKCSLLIKTCLLIITCGTFIACSNDRIGISSNGNAESSIPEANQTARYKVANGCYAVKTQNSYLSATANSFALSAQNIEQASKFLMRPADLGVYLLYDAEQNYLTSASMQLGKSNTLQSETTSNIDELEFITTNAEWELQATAELGQYLLFNVFSQAWLSNNNLTANRNQASTIELETTTGCASFPESEVGATYTELKTHNEDGTLFGYADAHEHIMTNVSGPESFLHGGAFHKLGIQHALPRCDKHHGPGGARDIMDIAGGADIEVDEFLQLFAKHLIRGEQHHSTQGYPNFADWPKPSSKTHQQMYYKWIERAWLSGLRFMIDYTVSPEVQCNLLKFAIPEETGNRTCNEMESVDRHFDRIKHMERYIDAQHGGPGEGWFRLVYSPQEARDVIAQGKLAVVLGMEIENPFNCFRRAREGFPLCTEEDVQERLDEYYDKGLRALFPVHKFTNGFGTGDGTVGVLEVGDYINTGGEWRDYVPCSSFNAPALGNYEGGSSLFTDFVSFPEDDLVFNFITSSFSLIGIDPILPLYPKSEKLCQREGLTDIGKYLMRAMMRKGMIIDVGHYSTADYIDGYEIFTANDYPPVDTHGGQYGGKLLDMGGYVNGYFNDTCRDANVRVGDDYLNIVEETKKRSNNYQYAGIGYDFNGISEYASPRYGSDAQCAQPQSDGDKLQYPFTSFAGDVLFERIKSGNKVFDFNEDGLAHIGMLPDIIQDVRNGGVNDEELQYLFRSAEGFIRVWEKMYERREHIK